LKEESYFFALSRYEARLLEYIQQHPDFILPKTRRNEVLRFIEGGLKDLSISRTSFRWGVPVPVDPERHIIYVWFDALTNYLTAAGYPDDMARFSRLWPADVHLMSKDILRFHAVYWPAFLMAAGLEPPRQVVVHGWWTVEGRKMSKSLGNTIDPNEIAQKYGVDALRYFVLREVPFGNDGDFSQRAFVGRLNNDLANDLGNLVQRSLSMLEKYFGGEVPEPGAEVAAIEPLKSKFRQVAEKVQGHYEELKFSQVLLEIWDGIGAVNKFIDETAPWALYKDAAQAERLRTVMYAVAEALRKIALLVFPVMPETAEKIWLRLGCQEDIRMQRVDDLRAWGKLRPGQKVCRGEALFPRVEG